MNLKQRFPGFRIWAGAQADIDHIATIWRECFSLYGGPYLFGTQSMADAMYAPVCARFTTYDVKLEQACSAYRHGFMAWSLMKEWIEAASAEPDELEELDVEF
jgi:glutathione S-transferase